MTSESEVNYFIKMTDYINKSEKIISKQTTLNSYMTDFKIIIDELSKTDTYYTSISNGKAELFKNVDVEVKGYIFNTKTTVTKLTIELNLIKIEEALSKLFTINKDDNTVIDISNKEVQTENFDASEEKKYQEKQVSCIQDTYQQYTFYDEDFSDFQEYKEPEEVFTDIKLNSQKIYKRYENPCQYEYPYQYKYPYEDNVIVPTYNPATYNQNNPFNTIMGLRGDTDNIHLSFSGSQVPATPTKVYSNTWSPDLINELKFKLTQPNAGLNYSNTNSLL